MQIGPPLNCRQNKRSFSARCRTDVALFLPLLPSSPSWSPPPPSSSPPSSSSSPAPSSWPQSRPASPFWSRITTCKHGLTQSPADSKVRLLLGKSLMMTMMNTKHHLDPASEWRVQHNKSRRFRTNFFGGFPYATYSGANNSGSTEYNFKWILNHWLSARKPSISKQAQGGASIILIEVCLGLETQHGKLCRDWTCSKIKFLSDCFSWFLPALVDRPVYGENIRAGIFEKIVAFDQYLMLARYQDCSGNE